MLKLRVGQRIRFKYPTKSGIRTQSGRILPCYPDDPTSPAIGYSRTNQKSQGTGLKHEEFIRIPVHWGRGYATFMLRKIVPDSLFVEG